MGSKLPTNAGIQTGDIFHHWISCADPLWEEELPLDDLYYQVVGLRGKTLVVLRRVRAERYVNQWIDAHSPLSCWKHQTRPLPGQFMEGAEDVTARVLFDAEQDICRLLGRGANRSHVYDRETPEDWVEWDEAETRRREAEELAARKAFWENWRHPEPVKD